VEVTDATQDRAAYKAGVKAEAEQQDQRLRDWLLDPSYGIWIGPKGSTLGVSPFRNHDG